MSEWQRFQLDEVAQIGMGQSPDSTSYNEDERGYPFLQGCAEFGATYPSVVYHCDRPTRIAPRGSILISVRAPVGSLNRANADYCIGRGLGYISQKSADIDYLFYVLLTKRPDLERVSQGSTFEAINSHELRSLSMDLPPLPQQRKIARILTTVDNLIEQTVALIEKYKSIKQGMMHDLFTRGVDSNGRLRPRYEDAPQLYKETALGWIPKEWDVDELDGVLERVIDYRGKTPTKTDSGIPLVTAKNVRMGFIDEEPREFIAERAYDTWMTRGIPKEHAVLFTTEAPLANVAQLITSKRIAFAQRIIILHCNSRMLDSFLKWLLMADGTRKRIFAKGSGSTVEGIKQSVFRRIRVAFPSTIMEQENILHKLVSIESQIDREHENRKKHQLLKTGLMQDLLTGKVRVNVDRAKEVTADV